MLRRKSPHFIINANSSDKGQECQGRKKTFFKFHTCFKKLGIHCKHKLQAQNEKGKYNFTPKKRKYF